MLAVHHSDTCPEPAHSFAAGMQEKFLSVPSLEESFCDQLLFDNQGFKCKSNTMETPHAAA